MKSASISELKKEIQTLPHEELIDVFVKIIKYKKENKEYLNYILFESNNEELYIQKIKEELDLLFQDINTTNIYFAKKTIRKILRIINKYTKYTDKESTVVELLIYFCMSLQEVNIDLKKSTALLNLYQNQVTKIHKTLDSMHEDLRFDFKDKVSLL